ncbi:hypothetical protein WHR41_09616, partial [Cladosporium halotolerans]
PYPEASCRTRRRRRGHRRHLQADSFLRRLADICWRRYRLLLRYLGEAVPQPPRVLPQSLL